jgi:hypothetical protein
MRVLKSTIIAMLLTATEALANGGGATEEGLSFMMILFMGFGAVILVFQIFPALILFCGMVKGIVSVKSTKDAAAGSSDKK